MRIILSYEIPTACLQTAAAAVQLKQEAMVTQLSFTFFKCEGEGTWTYYGVKEIAETREGTRKDCCGNVGRRRNLGAFSLQAVIEDPIVGQSLLGTLIQLFSLTTQAL